MKTVITYGTFDMFHHGHRRLLERAKELGDYLIVGVTADDFDKARGKINVRQSLMERLEAVQKCDAVDKVIVEEYEGQKIDDIARYDVDVFAIGSDWEGRFDYLKDQCEVVYLPRTEGVSSSELRAEAGALTIGMVGDGGYLNKVLRESTYVNGATICAICTGNREVMSEEVLALPCVTDSYEEMLGAVEAVYVHSHPSLHYEQVRQALEAGRHVLCESPIAMTVEEARTLFGLARERNLVLMEALRTAFSVGYARLLLLLKTGIIGRIVSVDATITNLRSNDDLKKVGMEWGSLTAWGPTAMLPVFQTLGTEYVRKVITTHMEDEARGLDDFTKVDFTYRDAVASVKVGNGVKSEGELVISGTKGYVYVAAPWWKTDYFEVRFEHPEDNKRYFYQLEGEGIRYELVAFDKAVRDGKKSAGIAEEVTEAIVKVVEDFSTGKDVVRI